MAATKVIILGGGFAGLSAAKVLGKSTFDVWLIDRANHHLFQPLLYEVATAALSPADIATPIREILSKYKNINVLMGEVISIDKENRIIALRNGEKIGYDFLIIALGARHSYFGQNEWEKNAPGLKTLADALKIREKILISFEKAERCGNQSLALQYLNFVIVGGGPTGVEMAGAIAEIATNSLIQNFRHIDPSQAKIFLIEGLPIILSSFPEELSQKAQRYLEKMGVQVMTNRRVSDITDQGVSIGDPLKNSFLKEGDSSSKLFIPSQNIIWAAGDQASPILKTLSTPLDRRGRVLVDPDLSIPHHPEIFVIGDAASRQLPATAAVANQQGRYVGKLLLSHQKKTERAPFRYLDIGMLAAIGKTKAIGSYKNFRFSGFFAWMIWGFVHVAYLEGFRNRLSVLMQWFFSFFTGQRDARLIYRSIDEELPKR
ncbi:MAG: ndh [Parachlamydiales bacterium]|nr:ndh [Parachlamydiales bacterium]